ncbi:MAG: CCA tRNA nucleotidyltransferase [Rickettsiales bacterium]|jgi:poly(A) polymerase|nr:CCA tRNA nucleotidyltransferase [Rickettsiales bacterium]
MAMESRDKVLFIDEVKYLFRVLLKEGDELRLVGGCVRDYLAGSRGKICDYDFATSYRPEQLIRILDSNNIRHIDRDIEFGTVVAMVGDRKFEITSLRKDIATDGRHAVVEFNDDYREDAKRRDFTFNALYCDGSGKIYDYFSGVLDLKKVIIRFIGDPEERILEDHLRILRFFRFYSSHCFFLDYRSLLACRKHGEKTRKLSQERITKELCKILESSYPPKTLKIMEFHGILQSVLGYSGELDLSNLEIFFSLEKYVDFSHNYLFILILLLSKNKIDLNLALRRREKIYISSILDNVPKNISHGEIKKLLFLLEDVKKVRDIVMVYLCNCYSPDTLRYLDLVAKIEIPRLAVEGKTLEDYGFTRKKEYSRLLAMAKNIFIESEFTMDRKTLMEELKNRWPIHPQEITERSAD